MRVQADASAGPPDRLAKNKFPRIGYKAGASLDTFCDSRLEQIRNFYGFGEGGIEVQFRRLAGMSACGAREPRRLSGPQNV